MDDGEEDLSAETDEQVDEDEPEQDEYETPVTAPEPSTANRKNKKKKKNKGKGKQREDSSTKQQPDDEDIDEILKELAATNPSQPSSSNASSSTKSAQQAKHLLAADPRYFDADAEMRRMFGARVVNEEIQKKKYIRTGKRTALVTPREGWPRPQRLGLSMEQLETKDGITFFGVVHARGYQELQAGFFQCVNTHDPTSVQNLLYLNPYHVDSLLLMSEVFKHSGDHAMASEMVERAIFAFEKSFHTLFNLATGACRLSYLRFENRAFHLALFKHINYLARRGCWRTAFEFARVLLSLDPEDDPLGTLQSIDFYALNAKEYQWYKSFYEEYKDEWDLGSYPNHAYSYAFAVREVELERKDRNQVSSQLLRGAIQCFPSAVLGLYEKVAVSDSRVSSSPFFQNLDTPSTIQLLVDLYVERTHSLWKLPETLQWLRDNVVVVLSQIGTKGWSETLQNQRGLKNAFATELPRNVSRHIFLSEFQSVSANLPPEALAAGVEAHNPLPPENAPPSPYDEIERNNVPSASSSTVDGITDWIRGLLAFAQRQRSPEADADDPTENAPDGDELQAPAVMEFLETIANIHDPGEEGQPGLPAEVLREGMENGGGRDWLENLVNNFVRLRPFAFGRNANAGETNPPPIVSRGDDSQSLDGEYSEDEVFEDAPE
ncbi:transcriptional repressor TCF25-domain-containing protein [Gaertneriomyces semiglobifer]|nr:transcriptional repressor TCF25-domain-containing protein [Gaertneriomyces semiglobifer]